MSHTARFETTYADNVALLTHLSLKGAQHTETRARLLRVAIINAVTTMVMGVFAWYGMGRALDPMLALLLILLGVTAGGLFRTVWILIAYPRFIAKAIRPTAVRQRTGPLEITLEEDGVHSLAPTFRTWWSWREVASVDVLPDRLVVVLNSGAGIGIPKRARFDSETGFETAAAFAQAQRAVAPPTAPSAHAG